MADIAACPDVFSPREELAEVTHLSANATALLENIADYDIYFASLYVRLRSEVIERGATARGLYTFLLFLAGAADPAKLQTILRATAHKIEWQPSGNHAVDSYALRNYVMAPQNTKSSGREAALDLWLERNVFQW